MFTNILLLSLLSITCGITNGEDSNQRQNAFGVLEMPIQQQREDMNFFKIPRAIRTPFRNNEIMTARGFGKRASRPSFLNGEAMTARGFGKRNRLAFNGELMTARGFGKRDDLDEDEYSNDLDSYIVPPSDQRSGFFPFFQNLFQYQKPQPFTDVAVPKRNDLKFRLSDGNLRIGRGFGKRSYFLDVEPSNSDNSAELMKAFSDQNSNQQLKPKESKDEET